MNARPSSTEPSPGRGAVKSETVILVALLALAVGFVAGVAFGVYRTGGDPLPVSADAPGTLPPDDPRLTELTRAAAERPDDPDVWVRLGHLHFDAGDTAAAIEAYEKALALKPDAPDVVTDLGVMYRRSGDPRKALDAFERALEIDPRHEIALFNKGIVLLHDLNEAAGAIESWERLLAIAPGATTPGGQPLADLVSHVKTHLEEDPSKP